MPKCTGLNLNAVFQDLANFTPFPDEWTVEDKVLFEQVIFIYSRRIRICAMIKSDNYPA